MLQETEEVLGLRARDEGAKLGVRDNERRCGCRMFRRYAEVGVTNEEKDVSALRGVVRWYDDEEGVSASSVIRGLEVGIASR